MELSIKVSGLEEFRQKIDSRKDVQSAINKGIKKIVFFLEGEAIVFTPVDTGVLRNSFREKFKNLFGEVFNIRKYGIFVHEGTRYIKKKQPFMTKALNKNQSKIELFMNKEINKYLNILK